MSVQNETKTRRILERWRGASEAHIRSDLQRASNEASAPKDQRISLIFNAIGNYLEKTTPRLTPENINKTKRTKDEYENKLQTGPDQVRA